MALWLLRMCNSMTSISCFVMAGGLLVLANRPMVTRRPALVHILVAAMVGFSSFALFFDTSGGIIKGLGRNPTLTGRTAIWRAALPLAQQPADWNGLREFLGREATRRILELSMMVLLTGLQKPITVISNYT